MSNKIIDGLIATAKGAVSILPGGGILAEYIGLAQTFVADKRINEWKILVEKTLERIPRTIEDLAKDEAFYSCIQVATLGAMRAFQLEKQKLFANAVYSAACNIEIDNDKKLFYLSLLSDYTLSHILLLNYFSKDNYNPNDDIELSSMMTLCTHIGATERPITGICENIPAFANDISFAKHITGQFYSDSLVEFVDFKMPVPKESARAKKTTKYGDEFLTFIQDY